MMNKVYCFILFLFFFTSYTQQLQAQPTWTIDPFGKEKKPQKFENRKLGSEKTANKKFTKPRRFFQNTITHYNYYFNANNKLNNVVDRATASFKDDYSKLLPFYPFDLETTSTQKTELDSVIYTATAGILLHDLRNDWIDNMYLLIGKAYYLRKDFDSAASTFQFINYNLFPRIKKETDNRVVGGYASAKGNSISIANNEKRNFLQKVLTLPPSRNDALIWLLRTLIEQNEIGESGGLINTLQNDPNLPQRLQNDLHEVVAYWFYKQNIYDSAAVHLEKGLTNASTFSNKARWEFLLAQLYEMNGAFEKASDYYNKASAHTSDPIMDIFAKLNNAKMVKGTDRKLALQKSIDNLLHMAKKDKYDTYRDIIYFSAAELILQLPDTANAVTNYQKSLKYNSTNVTYKNKVFLQLADIAFTEKKYQQASSLYDSLVVSDTALNLQMATIQKRKDALIKIVKSIAAIQKQDSLQQIAALPIEARDAYLKKLSKKLRKERGLKEDDNNNTTNNNNFNNLKNEPSDLFASNKKNDWYFDNSSQKSRGFSEFKTVWGKRINVDNWRRKSALDQLNNVKLNTNLLDSKKGTENVKEVAENDISVEALLLQLPTTPEKLGNSNDVIAGSLLDLAKAYQNDLEDYAQAAITYEDYLQRFPNRLLDGEVYLNLFYCYNKLGNIAKADFYKNLLNQKFNNSRFAQMVNNPAALNPKTKNPAATKTYQDIYNQFIEGNFTAAITQKQKADSLYGVNYWTPQLLYISALYQVRQRCDSAAIAELNNIIQIYPASPLKEKATTMIDVLKRRAEIEGYLSKLEVTRLEENIISTTDSIAIVKKPIVTIAPTVIKPVVVAVAPIKKDSIVKVVAPPLTSNNFVMNIDSPHVVIMLLDKVDGVYITEAKNAFNRFNKQNFYSLQLSIDKQLFDVDKNFLVISNFANADEAIKYYEKIKRSAPTEVSWLPAAKYSFFIITNKNLQVLKESKKLVEYKKLLNTQFTNKF
jgi:tetratricopeptide (TPR) repeat protein